MVKVKNDLTGQKFGHLTVIKQVEPYVNPASGQKTARWLCKCDCGAEVVRKHENLIHAKHPDEITCSRTCMCIDDLVGKKFGRLTVVKRAPNATTKHGTQKKMYECLCDCGNTAVVYATNLKNGNTKSCGCINREMIAERNRQNRGYMGYFDGEPGESRQNPQIYAAWRGCFERCYTETSLKKHPTYQGCEVSEKWNRYSDFKKWYEENSWYDGPERICLDKDILVKGNRIYGPDTCVLVPLTLNCTFVKNEALRGDLPIGVIYQDDCHYKYEALIRRYGKQSSLGHFETVEEAFAAYKIAKEAHLKEVADWYKEHYPKFPQKLYDAMYNYTVEITD